MGTRSLAFTSTSTEEGTYWMQYVSVKKGETYTFSMYVKAVVNEAAENGRCFIRMRYFDKNGTAHNKDSEWITKTTSGFMQLHTTCTIPADTADERVIVYLYLYHVNGSVYGDVAQLEPGTVPSRCNLVDNGDFHLGNIKGFSNTGTAACDEITTIGAGANLPAQYAMH